MKDSLFTREWLPEGTPRGGFLLLHGMESHSGWFDGLARSLNGLGWAATACDRPGWGESPGPAGHLPSYRDVLANAGGMAQKVRDAFGSAHVAGMSWGGMAVLYFALRRGWMADSFCMIAPGLAVRGSFPPARIFKAAYALFSRDRRACFDPSFPPAVFSDDPDVREHIANDRLRVKRVSASFCLETMKMRAFIKQNAGKRRVRGALCLLAQNDRMIDNDAVGEICRRCGVDVETIPGAGHALVLEKPEEIAKRLSENAERAEAARRAARSRVWIVGGGAVGGAVGSLLSFAGHEVGVLVKPRQMPEAGNAAYLLSARDCRRNSDSRLRASSSVDALPADPDLLIMAVKSFDTAGAVRPLCGRILRTTVLATLQNGLTNEEIISRAFPGHPVAAGSICAGLEFAAPRSIVWPDDRGGIGLAAHAGETERVRDVLLRILPDTGMECAWIDGPRAAERLKWSKLMLNIMFNALNSVTGLSSEAILRDKRYGDLAVSALREGFALMDHLRLRPVDLPGYPIRKLRLLLKGPRVLSKKLLAWQASRSVETSFSMLQDIKNHRRNTEIDELNGAVTRYGDEFGLNVEANRELCRLVREIFPGT